jgi:hypothetical protein
VKKQKAVRKPVAHRPSKFEELTNATEHNYQDSDTGDVNRRAAALRYEGELTEDLITSLLMRLTDARAVAKRIEAQLLGLSRVVEVR